MPETSLLLGVDYGTAKAGVAIGSLIPSQPLDVIHYDNQQQLLDRLMSVIQTEKPNGIVIGWPADHLTISTPQTENIRKFGEQLSQAAQLPVVYQVETLTTQLAMRKMLAAGIAKHKRRLIEDSYAASVILDDYLQGVS